MKLYLAGPMSGIKSFNFPEFDSYAERLAGFGRGHEVVSPAEIDSAAMRAACLASKHGDLADLPPGESYGALLGRDIQIVIDDVDGVFALQGWETSRGARIEVFTAVQMGKPVYSAEKWEEAPSMVWPEPREYMDEHCALTDEELSAGLGGGIGVLQSRVESKPEPDVIGKIAVEKTRFETEARTSNEILVGEAAAKELDALIKRSRGKDDSLREVSRPDMARTKQTTVFGLPVTLAPWLSRDAVLVIGAKRKTAEEIRLNKWIDKAIEFGKEMVDSCRIDPIIRDIEFIPGVKDRDGVLDPRKPGVIANEQPKPRRELRLDDPELIAHARGERPGGRFWQITDEAGITDGAAEGYATANPGGEVRTTSATGGEKGVKPERLDLIPPGFLEELGRVFGKGAEKYSDTNYIKGYEWRKSIGAGLRHWMRFLQGEDIDPETGCHHLAHAAWHCATLITFQTHDLGTDDRLFHAIEASKRGEL